MAWNTPSPPKPPGEWDSYSAGLDYKGWTLSCGDLFHIHITSSGGQFYTSFNHGTLPVRGKLNAAREAAEREIVRRIRAMLPAYRAIFERVEAQALVDTGKVTPLRPKKD